MKESDKTTDDKANTIIDIVEMINGLKESGEIQFINYKWDEKNNVFHITTVPKQTIKYIQCNFTITPDDVVLIR